MGSARTKMISQLGQFVLGASFSALSSGLSTGSQAGSASVGGVVNPTLPKGMFAEGAL